MDMVGEEERDQVAGTALGELSAENHYGGFGGFAACRPSWASLSWVELG